MDRDGEAKYEKVIKKKTKQKLTAFANSPPLYKILVAAEYGGVKINVNSNVERGVTVKTEEFAKLNPNRKVPVLETEQGSLWESNAIARYVGRVGNYLNMFGSNSFEAVLFFNIKNYVIM